MSYEKQPIGGKSQEQAREQHIMNIVQAQSNKLIVISIEYVNMLILYLIIYT